MKSLLRLLVPASLAMVSIDGGLAFAPAAPLNDSVDRAQLAITAPTLLSHISVLASDEYGGRAPGTAGEEKTVAYLIAQCRKLGLKPGNPDGTFLQKVALWGIRSEGSLSVNIKGHPVALTSRQDYLASSQQPVPAVAIQDSALVFAGYGVIAPEFRWDDYKGIDVKGKTVVLLSGDPPVPDPNDPSKLDEKMFLGPALSYYGRPATKAETAYSKGAVAVITIFAPRNGANLARFAQNAPRETMILRDSSSESRISAQASLSEPKARELFTAAGQDLDALRQKAVRPDFQPVALPGTASFQLRNQLRQVDSANVVALVPGSDTKVRDEYVIYSGHWDHLGTEGDKIYHGASDNAAGTAGVLELARAFTKLDQAPRRTVLFLWTTAEEKGLLGAQYYVKHPLYPLAKTMADINLDYFSNWGWGRTRDISVVGLGNSSLDDLTIVAAKRQGRVVTGDTDPAEGFYFRSDHLEFAKAGVPSLETSPGIDFVGRPAGYGVQVRDKYIRDNYHKVTDQVQPDWDLSGAVEDLKVLFEVGYQVAQGDVRPAFKPNAPYQFAPRVFPGVAPGIYPVYEPDDNAGFVPIFDGKTLTGWDGDPMFWRAEKGEIVGETTPEKVMKVNSFLIWRGGTVRDFELKCDFKLGGTNSGIQYRSIELPEVGKWVLKGYQADMDITNGYTGNLHEERGRKPGHVVLAQRGQMTRITEGPKYKVLASIGDNMLLRGVVNVQGWNSYHIIARGPVMMQILNGQLISATIDEDTKNFVPEGLIGLQMHVGPPFKVEFRNILYRKL